MHDMTFKQILTLGAGALAVAGAGAHVSIEPAQAPAGGVHKISLRVMHGCDGSPTVALRVQIPPGVGSVRAQPKPGWTLSIARSQESDPAHAGHAAMATERVSEVVWSGGSLPDEQFDEFNLVMKLPASPGTVLAVPVVQECGTGRLSWIEPPAPAGSTTRPKQPAPTVRLVP
jgi:uncharacterized protein YcnI